MMREETQSLQLAQYAPGDREALYHAVVQQVSEAIFLLDVETMQILEANAAFTKLLGYSADEVPHLTIYDLLPYERSRIESTTRRAIEQGDYQVSDRLYRRKDGSLVLVQVSITAISYSGKQVLCEVLRDISAQKSIEDILAARVKQQAAVAQLGQKALAGADVASLMDDAAHLVTETLEVEYCKILEHLPDGSALFLRAGVGWADGLVGHTTIGTGLDSQAGYALASGEPVIVEDLSTETRFHEPPMLHNHGVVSGLSVIIRGRGVAFGVLGAHTGSRRIFTKDDIYFLQAVANVLAAAIERSAVEEQLQESRDQLEVILQGVADGITVQNLTGKVIYANSAALSLIGYDSQAEFLATPQSEVLGKFDLLDEQNMPLSPLKLPGQHALRGQGSSEMVVGWRRRDTGEKHWSIVKASPVKNEHGQVQLAVSIFRDVTERVERERNKDDFIALASHELKTPITSLKIFTRVLMRRFTRAARVDEPMSTGVSSRDVVRELARDALNQLGKMDTQLDKLTELVSDLLDTSKISSGKLSYSMEEFDLGVLIRETIEDLQRIADKHTIVFTEEVPHRVTADRERIRQVVTNLITNAIKYSPQSDRILVRLESDEGGEQARVSVQDFGIGVPKSEQSKIFNRFFQVSAAQESIPTRDTFPGLGLGLYISSEIIKRHSGKIWVESDAVEGSIFYFTLPTSLSSANK